MLERENVGIYEEDLEEEKDPPDWMTRLHNALWDVILRCDADRELTVDQNALLKIAKLMTRGDGLNRDATENDDENEEEEGDDDVNDDDDEVEEEEEKEGDEVEVIDVAALLPSRRWSRWNVSVIGRSDFDSLWSWSDLPRPSFSSLLSYLPRPSLSSSLSSSFSLLFELQSSLEILHRYDDYVNDIRSFEKIEDFKITPVFYDFFDVGFVMWWWKRKGRGEEKGKGEGWEDGRRRLGKDNDFGFGMGIGIGKNKKNLIEIQSWKKACDVAHVIRHVSFRLQPYITHGCVHSVNW